MKKPSCARDRRRAPAYWPLACRRRQGGRISVTAVHAPQVPHSHPSAASRHRPLPPPRPCRIVAEWDWGLGQVAKPSPRSGDQTGGFTAAAGRVLQVSPPSLRRQPPPPRPSKTVTEWDWGSGQVAEPSPGSCFFHSLDEYHNPPPARSARALSQDLTAWARTYCQRSSSRQGGLKIKKWRSEVKVLWGRFPGMESPKIL